MINTPENQTETIIPSHEVASKLPIGKAAQHWPSEARLLEEKYYHWDPEEDIAIAGMQIGVHGTLLVIDGAELWTVPEKVRKLSQYLSRVSEKEFAVEKSESKTFQNFGRVLRRIKNHNEVMNREFNKYENSKSKKIREALIVYGLPRSKASPKQVELAICQIVWPILQLVRGNPWAYISNGQPRQGKILNMLAKGMSQEVKEEIRKEMRSNDLSRESENYEESCNGRWALGVAHQARMLQSLTGREQLSEWCKRFPLQDLLKMSTEEIVAAIAMKDIPKRWHVQIHTPRDISDMITQLQGEMSLKEGWKKPTTILELIQLEREISIELNEQRFKRQEISKAIYRQLGLPEGNTRTNEQVPLALPEPGLEVQLITDEARFALLCACNSRELSEESAFLVHCVQGAGYRSKAECGEIHILFLRRYTGTQAQYIGCPAGYEPCVTVEYNVASREIVQARGKHNRPLKEDEENALLAWCKDTRSTIRGRISQNNSSARVEKLSSEYEAKNRSHKEREEFEALQEQRSELMKVADAMIKEKLHKEFGEKDQRAQGRAVMQLQQLQSDLIKLQKQFYQVSLNMDKKARRIQLEDGTIISHKNAKKDTPIHKIGSHNYGGHAFITTDFGKIASSIDQHTNWAFIGGRLKFSFRQTNWRVHIGGIRIKEGSLNRKETKHRWSQVYQGNNKNRLCQLLEIDTNISDDVLQDLLNLAGDRLWGLRPRRLPRDKKARQELREWAENWTPGTPMPESCWPQKKEQFWKDHERMMLIGGPGKFYSMDEDQEVQLPTHIEAIWRGRHIRVSRQTGEVEFIHEMKETEQENLRQQVA